MKICEDIRLWFRLSFEGKFAVVSTPLTQRGERGTDNLMQPGDPGYDHASAQLRLEIFLETYARAWDTPPDVLFQLRRLIAQSLQENSIWYAAHRKYSRARRSAIEALTFSPSGVDFARILGTACAPSVVRLLQQWHRRRANQLQPRASSKVNSTQAATASQLNP
jgi:hypothetical protein